MTETRIPDGAVMVFGFFDGMHLGHRTLLHEARRLAEDAPVVVWTLAKDAARGECLTTAEEKCRLFLMHGADYAVFEDFSSIRGMDGETFFAEHIAERYHPSAVVCGFNFTFGRGASCHAEDLRRFAADHGISCSICPAYEVNGAPVSSTRIRKLIAAGEMMRAAELLGSPYSVTAPVDHGKEIGRTIGHPTVNQRLAPEKLAPPRGVYAARVTVEDSEEVFDGVANLGSRPTVNADADDVTLETYIFGEPGDLYGRRLTTKLIDYIRPERKFDSLDALEAQIQMDSDAALEILERYRKEAHA